MKTNISIELTDEQRSRLADYLDGRPSKRLATRKDVVYVATSAIEALVNGAVAESADARASSSRAATPSGPTTPATDDQVEAQVRAFGATPAEFNYDRSRMRSYLRCRDPRNW